GEDILERGAQRLPARQPPGEEEEDDFLERGVRDEVINVVAPIDEPALVAVDEADLRGRDDDVLETGLHGGCRHAGSVRHGFLGTPFRGSMGRIETASLYHTDTGGFNALPGAASRLAWPACRRPRGPPTWSTSTTGIRSRRRRSSTPCAARART